MTATTTHIGGNMYGDGEYVVEFENVGSVHAPLVACVLSPSGHGYTLRLDDERPCVALAARIIEKVRSDEKALAS